MQVLEAFNDFHLWASVKAGDRITIFVNGLETVSSPASCDGSMGFLAQYRVELLEVQHDDGWVRGLRGWYSYSATRNIRVDCPRCRYREVWSLHRGDVDEQGLTIEDDRWPRPCPNCGVQPKRLKLVDYKGWPWDEQKVG